MTSEEVLARAEKAEKELAEFKAQAQKAAEAIFHQQEESYRSALAMAAYIKQLEAQIKEQKP
jgi:hypothetical protein